MTATAEDRGPLGDVARALAIADTDARLEAVGNELRRLVLLGTDAMTLARAKRMITGARALSVAEFGMVVKEAQAVSADYRVPGAEGEADAEEGPSDRVRMSSGDWRYSAGDGRWPRGLYVGPRHIAELPHVHARLILRTGGGRRRGTSYLMSATADGPRHMIGNLRVKDGSWAAELGMTLPDEPKTIQAAGTAVRQLAEGAREQEAVPRAVGDALLIPPRECLPDGYLAVAALGRAEALTTWRREVLPLAALKPNLAGVLGASAFAPFVGALGVKTHFFDMYGDADRGKTTALKLGASMWGDVRRKGGPLRVWNYSSDIPLARDLGALGVLPVFIDETGAAGFTREFREKLVYRIADGAQRTTPVYGDEGTSTGQGWDGILFVTGNAFIGDGLTTGSAAGVPKRIVGVLAPFTVSADHAEALEQLADDTYGHLGAELLERFDIAAARRFYAAASEYVTIAEGGNPRTWSKQIRGHVAGAMMLDEICGTGTLLADAAAEFAAEFLAEHCTEPQHDADTLLEAIAESIAREPARWPTVSEYREQRRRDARPDAMPLHGIVRLEPLGVRADDGEWIGVHPTPMRKEFIELLKIDADRAMTELDARGILRYVPSARKSSTAKRSGSTWLTVKRLEPKPAGPVRLYMLVVPPADDDETDDNLDAAAAAQKSVRDAPHVNPCTDDAVTSVTSQVSPQIDAVTCAVTCAVTPPPPDAVTPPLFGALEDQAPAPAVALADVAEARATCRACGADLHPALIASRAEYHVMCAPDEIAEDKSARPADVIELPAENAAPAPAAVIRTAVKRELAHVVIGADGRGYAPGGEALELPRPLDSVRHVGDLAALALELGAARLYVPREAREALGLPAEIPADDKGRPLPHQFTEAADPAEWDLWGGELSSWMQVYRMPKELHEGAAIAFPEWMDAAPELAEIGGAPLSAAELSAALDLIWRATTHNGEGKGGVAFARSPATTYGHLLEFAARSSRRGVPEAAAMPDPYDRNKKRPAGAPGLLVPGDHMPAAAEVPPGWVVGHLDVRRCYAAVALNTDFGMGAAVHSKPGNLTRAPGVHLVMCRADASAIHPMLTPLFPQAGRRRDVIAWMDTNPALWLRECGVPIEVLESWTWPSKWRPFESVNRRLLEARDRLAADGSRPALAAEMVVKGMANAFTGRLVSNYGGTRSADDWTWNPSWWVTIKSQAETRKQRNLLPMIGAGVMVLANHRIDTVYVAAPSLEALLSAPGTGGRPAIAEQNGKFRLEAHAEVTPELSAILADSKATAPARFAAITAALGKQEK